ncbi:aminotransferase-like domain-containing protein [Edaphocola aurantiacus]|uniref:aminotransferase-like domain-containing protein n=1 Tax=Edaphocola aurantiacus TaxID=2601682 RepID=UPI001C97E0C2|nr:PLP-dependent aminotransferase family protein [Edaphocola aurantiacus]
MSSPVEIPYKSFVQIVRDLETPIYMQVTHQLIQAIQRGYLPANTRLPGTRALSALLDLHRNTVVAAYEELLTQGWVEARPNKGTFVIGTPAGKGRKLSGLSGGVMSWSGYPQETGFTFQKTNLLDNPFEHSECTHVFNDGIPDIRLSHIDQHSRWYSAQLKRRSTKKMLGHYNQDGSEFFKKHLANYLNLSRGLHISRENLLITRSTEMSIYIASEILLNKGDIVLVGELSYFASNMIFQKSGAAIKTVSIDEEGIDVAAVKAMCEQYPVRMLYLTPHHHYPTTVTLSAQRRLALLELAKTYGFIILEDDYDYDFHYDKNPVLPLASADTHGMVIYVGSFGKSLAPGFRTGFIVAPQNLMVEMRKLLGIIDRQGDIVMEQALGEMIAEGEIHRYLKKSLKIYEQRRDDCTALLQQYLGGHIRFQKPSGGLAIWAEWAAPVNLSQVSKICARSDLFIPKTILYQNRNITAMRLGFGDLNETEMEKAIAILAKAVSDLAQ